MCIYRCRSARSRRAVQRPVGRHGHVQKHTSNASRGEDGYGRTVGTDNTIDLRRLTPLCCSSGRVAPASCAGTRLPFSIARRPRVKRACTIGTYYLSYLEIKTAVRPSARIILNFPSNDIEQNTVTAARATTYAHARSQEGADAREITTDYKFYSRDEKGNIGEHRLKYFWISFRKIDIGE